MALSMDEQRMLAEIERRLAAEDPGLATRLSSFKRPGPTAKLRSTRARVIGSLFTVALLAVVSLMIYAMVPFRAHSAKSTLTPQASSRPGVSAQAKMGPPASTAPKASASAKTATSKTATATKTAPHQTVRTVTTSRASTASTTAGTTSSSLGFTGP
jgi:cytoskeletal protein RodZ